VEPRRPQASEPEIAIPLTTPERIVEVKTSLDGRVQEFACDVTAREVDHVVIRYRMVKDHDLHGVSLHAGELTFGYFWFDRPYNLYHWVRHDGSTAAWYFNIGSVTRFDGAVLEWHDDAIDILATPDGRVRVLDEDELPNDLELGRRQSILGARDRVLRELGSLIHDAEMATAKYFKDGGA
jgi:predicted RNA-binding protein associated with RNAse of E/G family